MMMVTREAMRQISKAHLSPSLRLHLRVLSSSADSVPSTEVSRFGFVPLSVYAQLSKARLSALVVLSSSAGFLLAGGPIAVDTLAAVTIGTTLQACAANTFNQVYEIKTDGMMGRTRLRPLPSGRVTRAHAFGFGAASTVLGTGILAAFCNPLTAGLGLTNVFLYSCIYTPMKQKSIYNTWVGAVVGAIPPLMGYAAATGTIFSAEAAILSAGLFCWQFPHFFALAWLSKKDYLAGGHKMVPCFDPTGEQTGKLLTKYAVALAALPVASYSLGITSAMFPLESILFSGFFVHAAYQFKGAPSNTYARKVFRTSLWYLPLFMGLMIFHKNDWAGLEENKPFVLSSPRKVEAGVIPMDLDTLLSCSKAYMKSLCIHEIMAPPLTRDSPMCPVSKVTDCISVNK